jgi:hypothetical protein
MGQWWLYYGTINLTQDGGSYLDMQGDVNIQGGEFNVHGSLGTSFWPVGSSTYNLTMTDGVFDWKDVGIYLTGDDLNYAISGGTIRTVGSFTSAASVSVFTPSGGTVELYGTTGINVSHGTGSHFYNLVINKSGTTATAFRDMLVRNLLDIESGTFDTGGYEVGVGP